MMPERCIQDAARLLAQDARPYVSRRVRGLVVGLRRVGDETTLFLWADSGCTPSADDIRLWGAALGAQGAWQVSQPETTMDRGWAMCCWRKAVTL